jgi:hypothetical protein
MLSFRNSALWSIAATFLLIFVFILFFGVNPITALLTVVLLLIQVSGGYFCYTFIFKPSIFTLPSFLSAGFVFGTSLSVSSALFFATTPLRPIAWSFPSFVLIALSTSKFYRPIRSSLSSNSSSHVRNLLAIAVTSVVFLAQDYIWTLWLLPPIALIFLATRYRKHIQRAFQLPMVILGAVFSIFCLYIPFSTRTRFWWYLADDFSYFESIQKSLSFFNVHDQFGVLGENWFGYHILTFAWTAQIELFSMAGPWVTLTQIGPPVMAIFLAATVLFLIQSFGVTQSVSLIILPIFPTFFFYSYTSPSFVFGHIFLLGFASITLGLNGQVINSKKIAVLSVLAFFVFYAKFSNLPIAFLSCFGLMITLAIRRRKIHWSSAILTSSVSTVFVILTIVFSITSSRRGNPEFGSFWGFAAERFPPLLTIQDRLIRYITAGFVTSRFFIIPFLTILLLLLFRRKNERILRTTGVLVFSFTLVFSFYSSGWGAGYFVTAGLSILHVITLFVVVQATEYSLNRRSFYLLMIFGALAQIGIERVTRIFDQMTGGSLLLNAAFSSNWPILLTATVIFSLVKYRTNLFSKNVLNQTAIILLVLSIGASAGANLRSLNNPVRGSELDSSANDVANGSPSEISVALWIKENTDRFDLIASNHFCGEACTGPNWWNERKCQSGVNFFLPIYSERRFLVQGTVLGTCPDPPKWLNERFTASIQFANQPNFKAQQYLQSYGVDYFVVDRSATSFTEWNRIAKIEYSSNEFLVLNLDPLQS